MGKLTKSNDNSDGIDRSTKWFLLSFLLTFVLPFVGGYWPLGLTVILVIFLHGCFVLRDVGNTAPGQKTT